VGLADKLRALLDTSNFDEATTDHSTDYLFKAVNVGHKLVVDLTYLSSMLVASTKLSCRSGAFLDQQIEFVNFERDSILAYDF